MQSDSLIEARSLSRRYGPNLAVADFNLTLRKGEVLGLLGPNGAGKSTSMKMLTGNLSPTSGDVLIKGISVREQPQLAKRHLGYLPEQPPVYPELTVDEYLDFCAGLHGIAKGQRKNAVGDAKRDCGLASVGERLIGNLSKGFQQRVGLAQAIIHRPDVVVLDEPTVGLDPIQIREIRNLIAQLGQNHSVILSSHILPEIQAVCGRVMIINAGKLVYDAAIDAHLGRRGLVVAFTQPPAADALKFGGVQKVDVGPAGRFLLELADGADVRPELVRASVERNWGLQELRLETRTLEEIFVELTSGDATLREAA